MEIFKSNLDFKQYLKSELYAKKLHKIASKHICIKSFIDYACRAIDKNLQSYLISKLIIQHIEDFARIGLYIDHNNECGISIFTNSKGKMQSKIYIGYQGYYKIVMRNPDFIDVSANVVYDNDDFNVEYGSNPIIKHKPNFLEKPNKLLFSYAVLRFKNGDCKFETVRAEELEQMKNLSMTKNVWQTWPAEMQKKSAIKRLLKLNSVNEELRQVIAVDEQDVIDDEKIQAVDEQDVKTLEQTDFAKQLLNSCKAFDINTKEFAQYYNISSDNQEQCKAFCEKFDIYAEEFKNLTGQDKFKQQLAG